MRTRTPFRRSLLAALLTASALATMATTHAALVTWGAPQNITGDSDVSTAGTFVGALNIGATGVGSTTVNGVTFTGVAVTGSNNVTSGIFNLSIPTAFQSSNSFSTGSTPFSSLSAPYQALLSTAGGEFTTPITLTMSNLTVGATYQFEWWANVSTIASNVLTRATAGNVVTIGTNPSGLLGGVGQFALGTFVADATTQAIVFDAPGASVFNGFQLRQLAPASVPEPGTALAGLALMGLVGLRRRR